MGAFVGLVAGLGLLLIWHNRSDLGVRRAPVGRTWMRRRREVLQRAGLDGVGPAQLAAAQVVCGLSGFVAVVAVTGTAAVAACFGGFGLWLPTVAVRGMSRRRQSALREVWPDAVDHLGSAVRAGLPLAEGIAALATRGPTELRPAFARFAAAYRASGLFGTCLDGLKAELADPVGDRVCETLRVAREVGGSDLGAVLRTLSELLRADARTRAELETRQGWAVNAARLAVAAPWSVLLLLGTQSQTLRAYDSAAGTLLLVIGAAVCAIAYRLMLRIGRLPEQPRVLA